MGTTKKSIAQRPFLWLWRKVFQDWICFSLVNLGDLERYFAIVLGAGASAILRLTSFSWIFSGDNKGFSRWILLIRSMVAGEILGLPGFRDFCVQKNLKDFRCQPITVSGLTRNRADCQSGRCFDKNLHNYRNAGVKRGLGTFPFNICCWVMDNWLRRAKISMSLAKLDISLVWKKQVIICSQFRRYKQSA